MAAEDLRRLTADEERRHFSTAHPRDGFAGDDKGKIKEPPSKPPRRELPRKEPPRQEPPRHEPDRRDPPSKEPPVREPGESPEKPPENLASLLQR